MSKSFLVSINLNKNELQNAVMHPLATAPSNPVMGQVYFNSTSKLLLFYDGTSWIPAGGGGEGNVISVNGKEGEVILTQDDIGSGTTYVQTHNDLTDALKTLVENTPLAISGMYSATSSYAVGDYVIYEGKLYICNTAIASGESWTAAHWTQINITGSFAPLASPALTGTPTAPTAASGTNTTQIATTAFVTSAISSLGNALVFKGVVNSNSDLPATHTVGWVYKVGTAGTYAGVQCEVGDTIVCVNSGTSATNSDWNVLQANIDGAVTGPSSATSGHIATFNGTTGKIIQDGYGVATTISNDAATIPTTAAVNTAVTGLIKTATGTIATNATSATVSYSGTLINAYATMGGAVVLLDIAPGVSSVVFTTAQSPASAVTCTVVFA